MSVRAKFRLDSYETTINNSYPHRTEGGQPDYTRPEPVEKRTLVLHPVYGNGDPEHENTRFWEASPSGELKLGCVNPAAWEQFQIGREYYIDFTPAD